jgi:hypothetical protein
MQQSTLDALCAYRDQYPIDCAGPIPRKEVRRAEEVLGVRFHADYAEFVELFGGAIINGIQQFGLRRCELAAPNRWSVIVETENCREVYGDAIQDWCIVSADNEYPVGIMTNGEVAGYYYDASPPPVRVIAKSYEDFLLKSLKDARGPFDIWGK